MKNAIFGIALVLLLSVLFTGCGTINGIGKDIQSASEVVQDKLNESGD